MKREFLTNLGLTDEQVTSVMSENGKDIEKYKREADKYKTELESTKTSLEEANQTIDSYKEMDIEGIQQSVKDWKTKYKNDTEALNNKLIEQERNYARDAYFSDMKFTSESAKRGIIDQFNEQNFELKDGKFIGADEFIKGLKETDASAFVTEEEPKPNPQLPRFSSGTQNPKSNQPKGFGFNFNGVRSKPKEN